MKRRRDRFQALARKALRRERTMAAARDERVRADEVSPVPGRLRGRADERRSQR
jgi:hypothetical protein